MSRRTVRAVALLLLLLSAGLAACTGAAATSTPTAAPAAGVVLQKILNDCWGVTQLTELDGRRQDHKDGFACARTRLLQMARDYPDAAEPHRVLAWGYLYAMQDEAAAVAEYERAAQIYGREGFKSEQAAILLQLGQLAMQHDRRSGCGLLNQAADLDPQNSRAAQLLQNFQCVPHGTPAGPALTATP
ncbi:MAG: hypothetical protein ACM3JD_19810 [Rudaea sp.]